MKPLTKDLARTGALVALATGSVLIPLRLLHRSAAPPAAPKSETLAVELFAAPQEGPDMQSIGVAINDNNEVVGTAFNEKTIRAFTVTGRKWALLPLPKGMTQSVAAGINPDGIVVGTVGDGNSARGLLWHGDKMGMLVSGSKDTSASTVSKTGVASGVAFVMDRGSSAFRADIQRASVMAFDGPLFDAFSMAAPDFDGMLWPRPGNGKSIGAFSSQGVSPSGTLVGLAFGKNGPVPAAFKDGKIGTLPKPEGVRIAAPLAANSAEIFVGAGVGDGDRVRPVGWSSGKTTSRARPPLPLRRCCAPFRSRATMWLHTCARRPWAM